MIKRNNFKKIKLLAADLPNLVLQLADSSTSSAAMIRAFLIIVAGSGQGFGVRVLSAVRSSHGQAIQFEGSPQTFAWATPSASRSVDDRFANVCSANDVLNGQASTIFLHVDYGLADAISFEWIGTPPTPDSVVVIQEMSLSGMETTRLSSIHPGSSFISEVSGEGPSLNSFLQYLVLLKTLSSTGGPRDDGSISVENLIIDQMEATPQGITVVASTI